MSNLSKALKTSEDAELNGIEVELGGVVFCLRRAGGRNIKFAARLEELTRPYRTAIERGIVDGPVLTKLTQQAWTETCVNFSRCSGLMDDKGEAIPFNYDTVKAEFDDAPEAFDILFEQSRKAGNFFERDREADGKNSPTP